MSWTLLAPASAIIITVMMLAWSLHRVELELGSLRQSLRRSQVTAVAADELAREARLFVESVANAEAASQRRAELRRTRRRSKHR